MDYIDIHTHNTVEEGRYAILNSQGEVSGRTISVGIHPWDVDGKWKERFDVIEKVARKPGTVAIGECGIDKLGSPATLELQAEAFRAHIQLAEKLGKPLIIHCVKTYDHIMALHKELSPRQPWIIHGFRGKPQLAGQLTKAGIYLSFGEHFNAESAKSIPAEQLLIESDDSSTPIEDIYAAVAAARGCSIKELSLQVRQNIIRCGIDI